jgi:hypothetical protein
MSEYPKINDTELNLLRKITENTADLAAGGGGGGAVVENVRVVDDASSVLLGSSDCVINYKRTDQASLNFGDPASQEGRRVLVCNNTSSDFQVGAGALMGKFFVNVGTYVDSVVDSVILEQAQTMQLQVVNGLWRVCFYQ